MLCQFLLYHKVNQLYAYMYPHIPFLLSLPPTLLIPPLQVVTKHRADPPVLCSSFPLAILPLVVYICQCYSLTTSQAPLPPLCPQVHSQRLHLYYCPTTRFLSTIFLDSIYMLQHMVFVFLFLTYCTLYDRFQVHPPHYK